MFTFSKLIPAPFAFHLLVGMELSEGCVAMNALAFVSITAVLTFKHVYCYRLPELSTASGNDPWRIIMKAFEGMVVLLAFRLIPLQET